MLSLIGLVASSVPRMSLAVFFFLHCYLSRVAIGLVYEVSLQRERGRPEAEWELW